MDVQKERNRKAKGIEQRREEGKEYKQSLINNAKWDWKLSLSDAVIS